jgi:hypothetical protein
MKLNIFILSLLAIVPLSGCNKIDLGSNDPKPCFSVASNFNRGLAFVEIPAKKCEILGISGILKKDVYNSYGYIDRSGKLVFKL